MLSSQPSKFEAHGEYAVEVKGDIINLVATGAWNLEAKQRVTVDLLSIVKEKALTRWLLLADISGFELGTPDFEEAGVPSKLQLIEAGLRKVAYVNTGAEKTKISQLARMQPELRGYNWCIFKSACVAKWWLRAA